MKRRITMPLCAGCKKELALSIGFTGCDWDCEAGKGSGYDYEIFLKCKCGRVYPLGMIKKERDFSLMKDILKA